jgi:hypothetical protein
MRPDLPKRLAARIRGAQAKVENARGWIEATEFNAIQDQARWDEYSRDPKGFAHKYYAPHGVDSYPVTTTISRLREKLEALPRKRERNRIELERADANLARVEEEVLREVTRMRNTTGRVPWPSPLEPFDTFHACVISEAYEERDTAPARRAAYLAEIDRQYHEEIAALEIERQAELDELANEMKTWSEAQRHEFRRVMGAIAQGLRDKSLHPSDIGQLIEQELKRGRR